MTCKDCGHAVSMDKICETPLQSATDMLKNGGQFDFTDLQVDASGTVRKSQFGYGFSEIVIHPTLKIACSEERERALDLLNKAKRFCLVSRAIDVPLRFEPQIEVAEPQLSV